MTCRATPASFSARKARTESSSPRVAVASGGGGTRKSLPDEMAHVFQVPALGSIWLLVCPNAGSIDTSIKTGRKVCDETKHAKLSSFFDYSWTRDVTRTL